MAGGADRENHPAGEDHRGPDEVDPSDAIDPELVERLQAWFSGPATSFPPPSGERLPAPTPPPSTKKPRTQRAKALDAVDPQLLEHLEGQGERSASLVEPLSPPKFTLDPGIAGFDFAVWGLQGIGEPRDFERPEDVQFAVQERAPQAILRDLHRPVRFYGDVFLHPLDLGIDRTGVQARAAIADLVYERRYRVDPAREPSGRRIFDESAAEIREILAQPWENSKPDEPRPVPSGLPDENDLRWFGSIGVDPDQ